MANPRAAKFRIGPQPTAGLLPAAAALDTYLRIRPGSSLSPSAGRIDDDSIGDGNAFMREPLQGGISAGPFQITVPVNFEELPYFLAYASGGFDVDNPTAGVYRSVIAPTRSGTVMQELFAAEIDFDDGFPVAYSGGRVTRIELSVQQRELVGANVTLAFEEFQQFAAATVVEQTGTGTPSIRGLAGSPSTGGLNHLAAAAERRVYAKVSGVGSWPTSVDVLFKVGDAATYGAQATTVPADTFTRALDSNVANASPLHNRIGDPGQQVEFYMPSSAAPLVDDEWYFELGRPSWSPILTTAPTISPVHLKIYWGGQVIGIENATITWELPFLQRLPPGQRLPTDSHRAGEHSVTVSAGRSGLTDYRLAQALLSQEPFSLELEGASAAMFHAAWRHQLSVYLPRVIGFGELPQIQAEQYEEQVSGSAHSDPGGKLSILGDAMTDPINFETVSSVPDWSL